MQRLSVVIGVALVSSMPVSARTAAQRQTLAATTIVACATSLSTVTAEQSPTTRPRGDLVAVQAAPVPLNPTDPSQRSVGDFIFAGGLVLTSADERWHALSDLAVTPSGQLTAVSDVGSLIEAQLVLDKDGRLANLVNVRHTRLTDVGGRPLIGKNDSDAEGLAVLPNGDRLVSFEGRARIILYPADGGTPRSVPMPAATFAVNAGIEAITADPAAGPDAYVVGNEFSGETWNCHVYIPTCSKGPTALKTVFYGLVSMRRLPGGEMAYLLRTADQQRRYRLILKVVGDGREVARLDLEPPMTVENLEGLALVRRPSGGLRFYLLSDDNASPRERTLLLAFDWNPREVR